MSSKKYLTKSEIRRLGFTDQLIDKLLSKPIYRENHFYKKGVKVKSWAEKEVLDAMKTTTFIHHMEEQGTRNILNNASKEKLQMVKQILQTTKIERIPINQLWELTKKQKANFAGNVWYECDKMDIKTKNRWMQNYVRHNLTTYDETIKDLCKEPSDQNLYLYFKQELNKKIRKVYPEIF